MKLTPAQKKFIADTRPDGWDWGVLSGPEAAMVRRLIALGHLVENFYPTIGPRICLPGVPPPAYFPKPQLPAVDEGKP